MDPYKITNPASKMLRTGKTELHVLFYSIFVLMLALAWSFVSHRPLMGEGAHWYYNLFQWGTKYNEVLGVRYFDYLFQAPGIFVLKVFGTEFYEAANQVAFYMLSFGWTMLVFFSLALSFFILRKHGREDLLAFQIIGMLAAYMQTAGFAIGLALPAMYCFWPLFYFLLYADGKRRSDYFWFLILALLLASTYETAIIFFGLFILMALADILFVKEASKKFQIYVILISAVIAATIYNIIVKMPETETGPFWKSLLSSIDYYRIFGLFIAGLTLPIPFLVKIKPKLQLFLSGLVALAFLEVVFWFGYLIYLTWIEAGIFGYTLAPFVTHTFYAARTTALPVTAVIAVFCYFFKNTKVGPGWLSKRPGRLFVSMIFVFSLMIAIIDVLLTNEWRSKLRKFESFLSGIQGCVVVESATFEALGLDPAVDKFNVPFITLMVQILRNETPATKLLFMRPAPGSGADAARDACVPVSRDKYHSYQVYDVYLRDRYIKHSIESK